MRGDVLVLAETTAPSATASLITIVSFVVLMCYGGWFGTMPAFGASN